MKYFLRLISAIIINSILLQSVAFAVDPVKYNQLSLRSEFRDAIQSMAAKRLSRIRSMSPDQQLKFLSKIETRYSKLIAKIESWSENKLERRQQFALKMLTKGLVETQDIEYEQDARELVFEEDEKFLLEGDFSVNTSALANGQVDKITYKTKTMLLSELKENQQKIINLHSKLAQYSEKSLNRSIASLDIEEAWIVAIGPVMLALGLTMIVLGSLALIGTLGIAAAPAIVMITFGALFILQYPIFFLISIAGIGIGIAS